HTHQRLSATLMTFFCVVGSRLLQLFLPESSPELGKTRLHTPRTPSIAHTHMDTYNNQQTNTHTHSHTHTHPTTHTHTHTEDISLHGPNQPCNSPLLAPTT